MYMIPQLTVSHGFQMPYGLPTRTVDFLCPLIWHIPLMVIVTSSAKRPRFYKLKPPQTLKVHLWSSPFIKIPGIACQIKWTTAMLVHLHTVHTLPTTAQLSRSAWSAEPKIFTNWPFTEHVCQCLMSSVSSLSIYYLPSTTKRAVIKAKSLSFSDRKCCETAGQDMGQRMRATLL